MPNCFLSLGANLGDRKAVLDSALHAISDVCGQLVSVSDVYETAPWGVIDQPLYLNIAILVQTNLSANLLLEKCQNIENSFGRERTERWGSRTLDIDILFYDDLVMETEFLTLPHPRLAERKFVLVPLVEIAPDFVHPILGVSIVTLLDSCNDTLDVYKYLA
jgi:2-amino-4-hydroxy-6-hydroxymethyldihydropteridine diphosphokinase